MTRVDPNLWQIPQWHPDWDGDFMFAGLRAAAKAVLDATDLDAKLTIVEDGYAHVDVFIAATRIGLVHVNRADDPSVPQFTVYAGAEDEELTTTDLGAAVRFLDKHRTAFPEDAR
jgi:Cys-tRNA synthase (O-phospho-L-seryl-tRNA:Cys-tRNA synthase)